MYWQKGGLALLLIVDLFLLYYIIGYYIEKSELDKWRKQHEKMLSQYRGQNIEKEIGRLKKRLKGLRGKLVLRFEEVDLLNYLTSSAQKHNLYDLKIREQKERGSGGLSDSGKPFELRAKGSFSNLWGYIHAMETGKLPLRLDRLKLFSAKGRVNMEAKIRASSFGGKQNNRASKKADQKPSGQDRRSTMQEF